ncbi:hypothetical protein HK097_006744, partial [Rhizophlyctis rosea]
RRGERHTVSDHPSTNELREFQNPTSHHNPSQNLPGRSRKSVLLHPTLRPITQNPFQILRPFLHPLRRKPPPNRIHPLPNRPHLHPRHPPLQRRPRQIRQTPKNHPRIRRPQPNAIQLRPRKRRDPPLGKHPPHPHPFLPRRDRTCEQGCARSGGVREGTSSCRGCFQGFGVCPGT